MSPADAFEGGADRVAIMKKIGIAQKVFSKAQWKEAQQESARSGEPVGDLLVARGFVTPEQLRALERAIDFRIGRNEDKELAKVILDSGYAEGDAVEAALERQKELYGSSGKLVRLGQLLVQEGVLSEGQHIAARKILEIARTTARPQDVDEPSD